MGKRISVEHARVSTAGFVKSYGTAYDSDDDVRSSNPYSKKINKWAIEAKKWPTRSIVR
jgi:hypothetical protein